MSVRWNLDDILPESQFDELYARAEKDLETFIAKKSLLSPSMSKKDFVDLLKLEDSISEDLYRLYDMPALRESANSSDTLAQKLKGRALQLLVQAEDAVRFFSHWIKGKDVEGVDTLDDNNARRLFAASKPHRHILERARELAAHTLTEPEERLATLKDANLRETLQDVRRQLETAQTFRFKPVSAKRSKTIATQSELMQYVHDPRPDYREAAYRSLFDVYKNNLPLYFFVFQGIQKDWDAMAGLRGYESPIAMRNVSNDLMSGSVELLLEVCRRNAPLFQRFFRLKARLLKQKKLSRFDLYAPYPDTPDERISYGDAVDLVMNTFTDFHQPFADRARRIIDEQHIDSHPRKEKSSGAFCATVTPSITPYVLLNYTGRLRDVSVIAHELGHGVHSLYANGQTIAGQNPTLPLAETASTFGELLVFERLLASYDEQAAAALLFDKLSDSYATVMRQAYFARFEIEAHSAVAAGVTAEELSDIYFSTLTEQFGDSVDVDELFRYEWSYIPHMVKTPFYVYAYAFGELLSLALFARYKAEGDSFIPKIEEILISGRTSYPHTILKKCDIDISSDSFWQGSFDLVEGWLEKLSKIFSHEKI